MKSSKVVIQVLAAGLALGAFGFVLYAQGARSLRTPAAADRFFSLMGQRVPLHELEEIPRGEARAIAETNEVVWTYLRKTYLEGGTGKGTKRGVHPKAHGCLSGKMTVATDLSAADQVGIFKDPGRQYDVVARFSNANPHPTNDDNGADSRGFGLKVLGVDGSPLLNGAAGGPNPGSMSQEFTMNNAEAFFADTAEHYRRFMEISLLEKTDFVEAATAYTIELFATFHPLLGLRVKKTFEGMQNAKPTNPLALRYFSMSAFQHGAGNNAPLVKYSLAPCKVDFKDAIDPTNPNYLRENLRRRAAERPSCFRFLVQDRLEGMDVEDPTIIWDKQESPFREVARIDFAAQGLMDEAACERQVINPWNTLPEHKPVGGINRLRLAAYLMSIEMRKRTQGN